MISSIVLFLKKLLIGMIVGAIIAVPVVLLWWKLKTRKIKRNIPPNMKEKIIAFKENERRTEYERERRNQLERDRRNQLARDVYKPAGSPKNVPGRGSTGENRTIPTAKTNSAGRAEPSFEEHRKSSKYYLPSFD